MVQFETKLNGFIKAGCKHEKVGKEKCDFKDETKLNFLICSSALKKTKQVSRETSASPANLITLLFTTDYMIRLWS